jgi:tripartite-type tricarboxylate transporter receptor subunit TctC
MRPKSTHAELGDIGMRRTLTSVVAALALGWGAASAQDYPSRTITIVVPFSAGGPTDTVTRLVAESMSRTLGEQVIVENVGGAGGTLGARRVAQAEPDGYTLLVHHIGMATSATLYRNLPYDPRTAFAPVGLITEVPMTLVARPDFPPEDLPGLIDYVKENADEVLYANAGIGAASQLCGMLIMQALDTQLTTVPYQGTGPAMTDLMGGQVDFMCDQTTNTTNQIKTGKIKGYAATTPARLKVLPDLPTLNESGFKGFEVAAWHAMWAPKGLPKDVTDKLVSALQTALKDEKVIARFADLGTEPVAQEMATPDALKKQLASEVAKWGPVIKAAGVKGGN